MKGRRMRTTRHYTKPWMRIFSFILEVLLCFLLISILAMVLLLGMESLITHPVLAAVTQIEDASGHTLYCSQQDVATRTTVR